MHYDGTLPRPFWPVLIKNRKNKSIIMALYEIDADSSLFIGPLQKQKY
jgi:hypothetical protein